MKNAILDYAKENNGVVHTSDLDKIGVRREELKKLTDEGKLVKVKRGVYSLPGEIVDEYFLIQKKTRYGIYSFGTALYFWDLSDRIPNIISMSVPQGYNVNHIKKEYPKMRFHYVAPQVLELGKVETISPQGGKIVLYDKERTICDIVKNRNKIDKTIFTDALNRYFKSKDRNIIKLISYAKELGIEDEVEKYMEVIS